VTESDVLREHGWVFESIRNHEEIDTYESVSEDVYVLEPPADRDNSGLVGDVGAGAAQTILRDEGRVAVTFNPNVAAEYTSLRLLLPGDPVYDDILDVLSGGESRTKFVCGDNGSVSVKDTVRDVGECDVVVPAVCGDSINSIANTEVLDVETAKRDIKQYLE
jgi:hypothetical protein